MKKENSRGNHQHQAELSWRRVVVRKWLNISTNNSDYAADTESDSDCDTEEYNMPGPGESRFKNEKPDGVQPYANASDALPRLRRRKSETFRAQYINAKEIKVCAATWNVGGIVPPDDLDLDDWLDIEDPADVYVIGLQEIIPLNAGNIFGAEDNRPIIKWENIIREALNQVPPQTKFKCFTDPPSPSKFKPSDDALNIEDEIVLESDSDCEDEIYPLNGDTNVFEEIKDGKVGGNFLGPDPFALNEGANFSTYGDQEFQRQFSSPKKLDRLNCLKTDDSKENSNPQDTQHINKFTRTLSGTERIGLSWPEPPLHLLAPHVFERRNSFNSSKSFKSSKSFIKYNSFKSNILHDNKVHSNLASLENLDLESIINRKRRPPFVRIVSKQMVGIFLTVWVRRCLRRHIQNLNVSTVGVGVMGYIGNKGSISVSMSIHQTLFCFVCTHLTAGERETDAMKRNADVQEIHRRTRFNYLASIGLPKRIYDHERIIWLGDLNYRINLSYERTRELISKKDWSMLAEQDQLTKELKKGRAFDGWCEGVLNFAPTYKYEPNSDSYYGKDPKGGRRTPAWCDRILSFGAGMKLLRYRRSEVKLSDHRPVAASYSVEVEVFSPRKLQRALTFTDAEIEEHDVITEMGIGGGMSLLRAAEELSYLEER